MGDQDDRAARDCAADGGSAAGGNPAPAPRGLTACAECQGVFPPSRMIATETRVVCGDCARRIGAARGDPSGGPAMPGRASYDARMVSAYVAGPSPGETDVHGAPRAHGGRYRPRALGRRDNDPTGGDSATTGTSSGSGPQTSPLPAHSPSVAAEPAAPARAPMSSRIIPARASVQFDAPQEPEPEIDENDPEATPRRRSSSGVSARMRSAAATELPSWAKPIPSRATPPALPPDLPPSAVAPPPLLPEIDRGVHAAPPSLSRTVLPPWEMPRDERRESRRNSSRGTASSDDARAAGQRPVNLPPPLPVEPRTPVATADRPARASVAAPPTGGGDRFSAYAELRRRIDGGDDTLETRRAAAEAAARLSLDLEALEHAKRCLELAPDDDRMRALLENVRSSMGLSASGASIAPPESPRKHAEEARPFWHDLGSAMTYPLRGQGLPVLIVGGLLIGLGQVIASVNTFAWAVSIMLWGYVSAYLFDVINSTGSGKTSPPEMPEASNVLESYVFPFFATVTCVAVSFAPCGLAAYVAFKGWLPPAVAIVAVLVTFAAGFFVFPMTLTVRAMFQSLGDAANPRVVFGAIGRIFPDYVAMFVATCSIWIAYAVAATAFYALCWVTLARPDASAIMRADVAGIAAWVLHTVLSWPLFLYALMLQGHLLGRMYRQGFKRLAWFVPPTEATRTARKMSVGLGAAALVAFVALAGAAWAAGRAYESMASGASAGRGTRCPIGDGAHLTYFWENTDGMAGLTSYRFAGQADGTMRVTASTRIAGQSGAPIDEIVGIFDPDTGVFTDAVPSWGQGVHYDGKVGRHVSFYGPKRASIGSTYVNDWSVRGAERWQATWAAFKVHDDQSTTDYYFDSASGVLVGSSFKGVGFVVTEWLVDSEHVAGATKGPAANRDFTESATEHSRGGTDDFYTPVEER
ncbi:MAG: hypothetical protein K8T90_19820 [Planctomycetes bacterium]|nr:hypothetical protein [Planctomycetota bacterium]